MPVTPTPGYTPTVTYDLIDLASIKVAVGIDPTDTRNDDRYEALIPAVSRAIVNYSGRDFASPLVTEERQYVANADDGGYLDIDDAASIISVSYANPFGTDIALEAYDWVAMPPRRDDSPVFTYIAIRVGGVGMSPEMGFTRNLDVLARERRIGSRDFSPTFKVTAEWGWPDTPEDVKMAAIWTIQEWVTRPSGEGLTAEAIEGYSRSWSRGQGQMSESLGIPARARDILAAYQKDTI